MAGLSLPRLCSELLVSCDSSTRYGRSAITAFSSNFEDALFGHSLKTYGWVYLIVAIVLILCGLGSWSGHSSVAGSESSLERLPISAIWWMPFYPSGRSPTSSWASWSSTPSLSTGDASRRL